MTLVSNTIIGLGLIGLNPIIGETLKICGKCKKEKTKDSFYVSKNKLNNWCKDCYKIWHLTRYAAEAEIVETECKGCKTIFLPRIRKKTYYCSRNCKELNTKRKDKQVRIESKQERLCLHCANVITQKRRIDAKFCSQECNNKAHQLQRKLKNRANEEGKRGYLRTEICERDKWICQICKKPVKRNAHHPNPQAPSLDHIIPVSKGGSSDPSNLQLTHLVCNLKRGNKEL